MDEMQNSNELLHVVGVNLELLLKDGFNAVFGLFNESNKTILIVGSTNVLTSLGRILGDIRKSSIEYGSLKDDIKNCKFVYLETNIEAGNLKLRASYWNSIYREKGYKFYKELNPVKYSLKTTIEFYGTFLYRVYIVNTRKEKELIAEFRKKKEMNEWIQTHYPDPKRIGRIVRGSVGITNSK